MMQSKAPCLFSEDKGEYYTCAYGTLSIFSDERPGLSVANLNKPR